MKKLVSLVLILGLALGIAGCDFAVSDDKGIGQLIVTQDNVETASGVGQTFEELDGVPKVRVEGEKLDEAKEASLGEAISLQNGTYKVRVVKDIYMNLDTIKVDVKAGETTVYKDGVTLEEGAGDITFKFDPSNYDFKVTDDAEVSIVGTIWDNDSDVSDSNKWTPGAENTLMTKNADGVYSITVEDVVVNKEYKIIVKNDLNYSWGWEDDSDKRQLLTPDGLDEAGAANYTVKVEDLLSGEASDYSLGE